MSELSPRSSEAYLQRLLNISWTGSHADARSAVALVRDYLRRSALCAWTLGCPELWPFFDIASQLAPEVRTPAHLVAALEQRLGKLSLPSRIRDTCLWALNWATLLEHRDAQPIELPDPFEPLITLYEQGGRFSTEHGYVDVEGAAFRLGGLGEYLAERVAVAPEVWRQ